MTKKSKKIVTDPNQMSLFDLLQQERAERQKEAPGRYCVSERLQAAVKMAIRNAPKSRETLADEISFLSGQSITVNTVNNWTAESHPHRIPAELLPAFCEATGDIEPLRILSEAAGVFTLQAPDALRAEIQQYDEAESQARSEKRKRKALLALIEGSDMS